MKHLPALFCSVATVALFTAGCSSTFKPEPGFVIAMLKRAQVPLNEALHALGSIDMRQLTRDTRTWITSVRDELFALRNDILDVMKELRMRQ